MNELIKVQLRGTDWLNIWVTRGSKPFLLASLGDSPRRPVASPTTITLRSDQDLTIRESRRGGRRAVFTSGAAQVVDVTRERERERER